MSAQFSGEESSTSPHQLRLRIFAGPNGSGKSTVISSIRQFRTKGQLLDFGFYVNSDDIVVQLKNKGVNFSDFGFTLDKNEFIKIAIESGLISDGRFSLDEFTSSFELRKNRLFWKDGEHSPTDLLKRRTSEALAQVVSQFLHRKLISLKKNSQ